MSNFFQYFIIFAEDHWFLAWCALWALWAPVIIAKAILFTVRRLVRALVVALRGWPPEHLDADGDWQD